MVKRKRIVNLLLPTEIIQHIQSFLNGKEAAQTSILSKFWYRAWLTRSDLHFDQHDFGLKLRNGEDEVGFWGFTKKTMQRYDELNLKVERFRLIVIIDLSSNVNRMNSLIEELIVKAMKMGVVDFDFGFDGFLGLGSFTLPRTVLESEALDRLSVSGIELKLGQNRKVNCSSLRSLALERVYLGDDNVIWDIISSCPLIENLTISKCKWIKLVVNSPCNLYVLHKLKSLYLVAVHVDPLFFSEVLSNFACLKDLSLENCIGYDYNGIELSSCSLECITFKQKRLLRANFDVPNIKKFEYSGFNWPSVSFTTFSSNWESCISVTCQRPSTKWFLKLQKLLTSLCSSKITLSLTIYSIVEKSTSFRGLTKTAVENLTIYASPSARSVCMECLFRACRPRLITLYMLPEIGLWSRRLRKPKSTFLQILWNRSVQRVRENCLMKKKNVFDLRDLEEVNVHLFEERLGDWKPLSCWETLLADSCTIENPRKIRFQLRWAGDPVTRK